MKGIYCKEQSAFGLCYSHYPAMKFNHKTPLVKLVMHCLDRKK